MFNLEFFDVNSNTQNILGLSSCVQLNLIKRVEALEIENKNIENIEYIQ